MGRVKQAFVSFWAIASGRAMYFSLGFLTLGGFLGGVIFWGGLHAALNASNTESFCISCHEMRSNPYQEMQDSIHFVNRTGIRAICSDCHVPKAFVPKIVRKIKATKELWAHIFGRVNTKEKFQAHRLEMAVVVWSRLKESDSTGCRNCHKKVWMDTSMQMEMAQENHAAALKNNLTCIDCHQGIAHQLPENFMPPSLDELLENPNAWLAQARAAVNKAE